MHKAEADVRCFPQSLSTLSFKIGPLTAPYVHRWLGLLAGQLQGNWLSLPDTLTLQPSVTGTGNDTWPYLLGAGEPESGHVLAQKSLYQQSCGL